jgi:hypothetical protein
MTYLTGYIEIDMLTRCLALLLLCEVLTYDYFCYWVLEVGPFLSPVSQNSSFNSSQAPMPATSLKGTFPFNLNSQPLPVSTGQVGKQ